MKVNKIECGLTQAQQSQDFNADFLAPLPREVALISLRILGNKDLRSVALVNKEANILARDIRLKRYEKDLEESYLWRCLHAMFLHTPGEKNSFVSYVRETLGPDFFLENSWLISNGRFYNYFCNWNSEFPGALSQLGFKISIFSEIESKVKALILDLCVSENVSKIQSCSTLGEVMNLSDVKSSLIVWKKYNELDQILSTMLLFTALKKLPDQQRLPFLIVSSLNRGLSGKGCLALDKFFSGLFTELLLRSIRLIQIKNKTDEEIQELRTIENIISRLSESDFLNYLNVVQSRYTPREYYEIKLRIVKDAYMNNHNTIVDRMNKTFIFNIVNNFYAIFYFSSHIFDVIVLVLNNKLVRSRFSNADMKNLLGILNVSEVIAMLKRKAEVRSKFDFFIVMTLVDKVAKNKDEQSALVRLCLNDEIILNNLDKNQVLVLVKYLSRDDFSDVLSHENFINWFENCMDKEFIVDIFRNTNLMKHSLMILTHPYFGRILSKNNYLLIDGIVRNYIKRLSNDNLIFVALSHPLMGFFIIKNNVNVLSLRDLVMMENFYSNLSVSIEKKELYRFIEKERRKRQENSILENYEYVVSPKTGNKLLQRRIYSSINWIFFLVIFVLAIFCMIMLVIFVLNVLYCSYITINPSYPSFLKPSLSDFPSPYIIIEAFFMFDLQIIKTYYEDAPILSESQLPKYCFVPNKKIIEKNIYCDLKPVVSIEHQLKYQNSWFDKNIISSLCFVIKIVCIITVLLGLLIVGCGVGSALGVSIMASTAEFLFVSLPISSSLAMSLFGSLIYFTSAAAWLIADAVQQPLQKVVSKVQEKNLQDKEPIQEFETLSLNRFCFSYQNSKNMSVKQTAYPGRSELIKEDSANNDNIDDVLVFKL